jgi:hypothetical protein
MVKFNVVKAATIEANNENEKERAYAISVLVKLENGVATNVERGSVKSLDGTREYANFSGWIDNSLSTNIHGVESKEWNTISAAINKFITALKSDAESINISIA